MAKGPDKGRERTRVADQAPRGEVTARSAFTVSFVLFSLLLAPIVGLGAYFGRDISFLQAVFDKPVSVFLGGFAIGILAAFVISIVFTRRAIAQASA